MNKIHIELLKNNLSRFDSYFNLANVKASFIIPTNAIFIGIYSNYLDKVSISTLSKINIILVIICIVLLIISLFSSLLVILAFLKSGNNSKYKSLLFFGSISEMSKDDFISQVKSTDEAKLETDYLEQIYLLSKSLKEKYSLLNISIATLCISIILTFYSILTISIK